VGDCPLFLGGTMENGGDLMYIAIRNGLNSKPELLPATSKLEEVIKLFTKDGYQSLYHYNEAHKKIL
jgi:hypothetical protein